MKYLLDTNIVIHLLTSEKGLSPSIVTKLKDIENEILLSSVIIWEIAIKRSLRKLKLPKNYYETLTEQGYTELPITHEHARRVEQLPLYHKDPFDRLLIAQAITENLTLVTRDNNFEKYEVRLLQA